MELFIWEEWNKEGRIHLDGNCFYRAILRASYLGETRHLELRQALMDSVEKLEVGSEIIGTFGFASIKEYSNNGRKNGTFVDEFEINTLARD